MQQNIAKTTAELGKNKQFVIRKKGMGSIWKWKNPKIDEHNNVKRPCHACKKEHQISPILLQKEKERKTHLS